MLFKDLIDLMMRHFPNSNVDGGLSLVVPDVHIDPSLHQDPGQLPLAHSGCDVESGVTILVLAGDLTPRTDQDPGHSGMTISCCCVKWTVAILK